MNMKMDQVTMTKVSDLTFDRGNPRLLEFKIGVNSAEIDVIRILWEAMDVRELVMSIAASGFFRHEPVIVARENGRNVVIEGNRRLAAVKVLLERDLARALKVDVPVISENAKARIREIPAVHGTREGAWRYLGFKHVNGPAKWSSYAKAQYIADVHRNFGVKLEDIARQIGDTHKTVQRLFRGLMVIEQAERLKVFDREDRRRDHFAFSHVYTGIGYPGIAGFLDLQSEAEENEEPVPTRRKNELGDLCRWLYGSKREKKLPVVETQNPHLRQLDAVVSNKEALAALRAGHDLAFAYETSRPSSTVFEESLLESKRSLQKARGLLTVGYDGSEQLLGIAGTVLDLAEDLYAEMNRKRSPRKRKRVGEHE